MAKVLRNQDRNRPNGVQEALDRAKRALADSKEYEPDKLELQVNTAEVAIARLRDCLIEQLRNEPGPESQDIKIFLNRTNIALSLVVGVEYPLTGIKRSMIDEAEKVLAQITIPSRLQ